MDISEGVSGSGCAQERKRMPDQRQPAHQVAKMTQIRGVRSLAWLARVSLAVCRYSEDAEEEGEDEPVAEEISWFSDVAAKRMSDMESSGTAADDGG